MSKKKQQLSFDPYKVLQLEPGCELSHIDKAYKRQALRWHPDKVRNGGRIPSNKFFFNYIFQHPPEQKERAQAMFLRVYEAYEFLKDVEARAAYDEGAAAKRRRTEYEAEREKESSAQRKAHLAKLHAVSRGLICAYLYMTKIFRC